MSTLKSWAKNIEYKIFKTFTLVLFVFLSYAHKPSKEVKYTAACFWDKWVAPEYAPPPLGAAPQGCASVALALVLPLR